MKSLIKKKNNSKILFTPGPPSLSKANLINLNPVFGRGDKYYLKTEKYVFSKIKKISGQRNIITTQGSGSTVLEMVSLNFLKGNVLIISTGYYSDRLFNLSVFAKQTHNNIKKITKVNWKDLKEIKGKYDWIWSCYTETSCGLKLSIQDLKKLSKKTNAKLAIDATASFGLEKNHKLADVVSFSSCKGLLGLTGAGFICYNVEPKNKVKSFVLCLNNAKEKKMTGPYHAIASLADVLPVHKDMKYAVQVNKIKFMEKMKPFVSNKINEPLLCTHVGLTIKPKDKKVILYKTRGKVKGSIVCHLGEVHLKKKAKGKIIDKITIS